MARQPEPPSSRNAMLVLVAGILVVGGLVAWALTRTVDVTPSPAPPAAEITPQDAGSIATQTAARNTPPLAPLSPTSSAPPQPPPDVQGDRHSVARIAAEDLRAKWSRGEVTVIDVRDENGYRASHIPGALHMQFASIEGQIDMIPKGKQIVLYCT